MDRVASKANFDQVVSLIAKKDWKALKRGDQLIAEQKGGRCFVGFAEADIDFAPTFKFSMEPREADEYSRKRIPSWTDRVLYRSQAGMDAQLACQRYYACHDFRSGDHVPVVSIFSLNTAVMPRGVPEVPAKVECVVSFQNIRVTGLVAAMREEKAKREGSTSFWNKVSGKSIKPCLAISSRCLREPIVTGVQTTDTANPVGEMAFDVDIHYSNRERLMQTPFVATVLDGYAGGTVLGSGTFYISFQHRSLGGEAGDEETDVDESSDAYVLCELTVGGLPAGLFQAECSVSWREAG
jgi:hypothetical protein